MTQEFDPRKSYLAVKANEKMIAYVSFVFRLEEEGRRKEGVVKISSMHRPYGGGYLTLTFMVDKQPQDPPENALEIICDNLTEDSLKQQLGGEFERMVRVDLDLLEGTRGWHVEEINIYFRTLAEREKVLIEEKLLPALECILPCKFEPVEWWPEGRNTEPPSGAEIEEPISLKRLFKK